MKRDDRIMAGMAVGLRLSVAVWLLAAVACHGAVAPSSPPPASSLPVGPSAPPLRVLMLTTTLGFRHDSIATARQVMATLAAAIGEFTVTATENLADVTPERLASTDILMFALMIKALCRFCGKQIAMNSLSTHIAKEHRRPTRDMSPALVGKRAPSKKK